MSMVKKTKVRGVLSQCETFNSLIVLALFLLLLSIDSCASGQPDAPTLNVVKVAAQKEFSSTEDVIQVTIDQAKESGVDYMPLLRAAVNKDKEALKQLFRLTAYGHLDAAGSQMHAAILWELLGIWGDKSFYDVLSSESKEIKEAVISDLDYSNGYEGFSEKFPMVYGIAKHP